MAERIRELNADPPLCEALPQTIREGTSSSRRLRVGGVGKMSAIRQSQWRARCSGALLFYALALWMKIVSAKAKRILALLNDPRHRARLMTGVNRADQDEPAQVGGGDREMKVLTEINAFEDDHERFMDSLKGVI